VEPQPPGPAADSGAPADNESFGAADPAPPAGEPLPQAPARPRAVAGSERAVALLEVLLCSDYPTQIAIAQALTAAGLHNHNSDGTLNAAFIAALSFADAGALVALILLFLVSHGERPRDVILGRASMAREALAGIPLVFVSLALGIAVLVGIQLFAPWLRTVQHNPLQDLLATPRDTLIFGVMVVVAGGVREEVQRAFLLHRFEQSLGGAAIGIAVVSVMFGAGHYVQGLDAMIATGVLGAFWGIVYLRRRSAIAPMVAHSGFNLLQLAQFFALGG
jgi:membrane protease YdiL (CAAX protease family)